MENSASKDSEEYKLSAELRGHSKDVRCLSLHYFPPDSLASGSRDGTIRIWAKADGLYEQSACLRSHKGFVSCLLSTTGTPEFPLGRLYSGSQDKTIALHSSDPPERISVLQGHTDTVACLAFDEKRNQLVSGSWDHTIRIWNGTDTSAVLKGHSATVWDVAVINRQEFAESKVTPLISASADKSIRLWVDGEVAKTFTGHTDVVRGLEVLNSAGQFLSVANDCCIRLWDVDTGEALRVFYGHENYIYSISLLPGGSKFASCGEDGTVRVWDTCKTEARSVILTPAQSVWCVRTMRNGDIACGSSDGMVRLFTLDVSRQASPEALTTFNAEIQAFLAAKTGSSEIGGIKIADLPGSEALCKAGIKEGQTKMVREGTTVKLYQWSAASSNWDLVGDVLSAKEPSGDKKMHMGKEYDYVIDVDVEDGKPPLKLPYNLSEDPWASAQKFIDTHQLPQDYLDQIAQFIISNAPGAGTGAPPARNAAFADPFTGANSYAPGSGNSFDGNKGAFDPLTGGNRYIPGAIGSGGSSGGAQDPFTGGGRYIPNGMPSGDSRAADPLRPKSESIPVTNYHQFENLSAKTYEKTLEFNEVVEPSIRISKDHMESALSVLCKGGKWEQKVSSGLVIKALESGLSWPKDKVVPILDMLHIGILEASVNAHFFEGRRGSQLMEFLALLLCPDGPTSVGMPTASSSPSLGICCGRILANAFAHSHGQQCMLNCSAVLIPVLVHTAVMCPKIAGQLACASALANVSKYALEELSEEVRTSIALEFFSSFAKCRDCLNLSSDDVAALFLQIAGTLIYGSRDIVNVAKANKFQSIVNIVKDKVLSERIKHLARIVEAMMQ